MDIDLNVVAQDKNLPDHKRAWRIGDSGDADHMATFVVSGVVLPIGYVRNALWV